ncbi:MAG TPA: hypothetical protein VF329_10230 [Gammaproteobacteria bacterium]
MSAVSVRSVPDQHSVHRVRGAERAECMTGTEGMQCMSGSEGMQCTSGTNARSA